MRTKNIIWVMFLLLAVPVMSGSAGSENVDLNIEELTKLPDEALALHAEAQQHFMAGFAGLDEDEYLKAAIILEELLDQYGTSPHLQDIYFALAEIYQNKLRGDVYAYKAIDILTKFMNTFPYLDKVLDAQLTISSIYFRHLNNLDKTLESLQTYFELLPNYNYLESEKLQGQVMFANCYQKMGKYGKEQKIWEALVIGSPSTDRTGRSKFLAEISKWKRLPGDGINLFFHVDVSEYKYTRVFTNARNAFDSLADDYSEDLLAPLDIFLYPSLTEMLLYTSRDLPFVNDSDRSVHLAIDQDDQLDYLINKLYGSGMDLRSRGERHPLMGGGFEMMAYRDASGDDVDHLAARYLLLFDESPGGMFFLRESIFFGSVEYDRMAGSFLKYLSKKSSGEDIVELYRGLTPRHTVEMIDNAFHKRFGKTLDALVEDWHQSLRPLISDIDKANGLAYYDLSPVVLDQSTPEKAVASYFEALGKGDFDALEDVSVPELGRLWRDAKETYEEEGILDEVRIVEYVYPWYDSTFKILRKVIITENLLIYTIEITREGDVKSEEYITLTKSGSKWYIEANP